MSSFRICLYASHLHPIPSCTRHVWLMLICYVKQCRPVQLIRPKLCTQTHTLILGKVNVFQFQLTLLWVFILDMPQLSSESWDSKAQCEHSKMRAPPGGKSCSCGDGSLSDVWVQGITPWNAAFLMRDAPLAAAAASCEVFEWLSFMRCLSRRRLSEWLYVPEPASRQSN